MGVKVVQEEGGKQVRVVVDDQFDYSLYQPFRESYRNVTNKGATFLVDLSKATYMDSSALGMLLLLKEHAEGLGGRVKISRPNDFVYKILSIAGFEQLMTIER